MFRFVRTDILIHIPRISVCIARCRHRRTYDPHKCWESDVDDEAVEFTLVIARWCKSSYPGQIHNATDVAIVLSFTGVDDQSPPA